MERPLETPTRDTTARGTINSTVRNTLWAKSAGRCYICNERCLGTHFLHAIPAGQMAHIVGAKPTTGSPRGLDEDLDDREGEENLLLLCHDCHKAVDQSDLLGIYTVERLRAIKRAHERRIEQQTRTGGLKRTAVLRVGGNVRGSRLLASRRQVNDALVSAHLLPVSESALVGDHECVIDLDPSDGPIYWQAAVAKLNKTLTRVREAIAEHSVEHLSVFAAAPIPLLVHLGFQLDDKTETRVFQGRPDTGWTVVEHEKPATFTHTQTNGTSNDVVLVVGVTGPPNREAFPEELKDATVLTLAPANDEYGSLLLDDPQALINFTAAFRHMLAAAETTQGARWHLIAAVPVSGAIAMGRALMRDAQPPTFVYQRTSNDTYENVLEVNP